jgi:hypothetical protein
MARLTWDNVGERYFETGLDRGVLYSLDGLGVVWNGLISVDESPTGGEPDPIYQDGVKQYNKSTLEEFEATITAYTYPDEFMKYDGQASVGSGLLLDNQERQAFNLSYRTRSGNDVEGADFGYKIHILYNAYVAPAEKEYETFGESLELMDFSWDISTLPVSVGGDRVSSHFVIDSTKTNKYMLRAFEDILYGTESMAPSLPSPEDLVALFTSDWFTLTITDNGDGTWTASGPDEVVSMIGPDEFQISWDSAIYFDDNTYTVSSG